MATENSEEVSNNTMEEMNLNVNDISADWIERKLSMVFHGPCQKQLAMNIWNVLADNMNDYAAESWLALYLKEAKLIKYLLWNRLKIVWCIRLRRARNKVEREEIEDQIKKLGLHIILKDLHAERESIRIREESLRMDYSMNELDLDNYGHGRICQGYECKLPDGSARKQYKLYEEVHVPALMSKPLDSNEEIVKVSSMPGWTRLAFKKVTQLNKVESEVYKIALFESDNLLICAPTDTGRLNIAVLAILELIGRHINPCDGSIDGKKFKIVYVAPEAIVTQVVRNLSSRLVDYNVTVNELSEDHSRARYEIKESQIIVTTAEKWEVVTRKFGAKNFAKLVKLFIIDEIYLLNDDRGPFLESIIARMHRQIDTTRGSIRMVGLSAPFPNYKDVAQFLHVDLNKGMFYFDNSCRLGPFSQQYFGIIAQDPLQGNHVMNKICYESVMAAVAGKRQIIIYVYSSIETVETARYIKDAALTNRTLHRLVKEDSASCKIHSANIVSSNVLEELLPCGIAIHHSDMTVSDRKLAIDHFREGHVKVLVSTRTLAWDVDLPCHTMIIKGTKFYNPEKGADTELSRIDVMQMVGRPYGEGIILTDHNMLEYYLSLMNEQLPIESQFVSKLTDLLNAEIVLGTVQNTAEACNWFTCTYMYAHMSRNPSMYGLASDPLSEGLTLEKYTAYLIDTAATILQRGNLVTCDSENERFQFTDWGRIASYSCITHKTIYTYSKDLKATMEETDLCRLFSKSEEFKLVTVRHDEQTELAKLFNSVQKHILIKESVEKPSGKIVILLRAHILHVELEGLSLRLKLDTDFITQSAGRLIQALSEVALKLGWVHLAEKALNLCKMVGNTLHKFADKAPRLILQDPHLRPITRTLFQFEVTVLSDFVWDNEVHGYAEVFWVMLENDGQTLHHQHFILKKDYTGVSLNFKVAVNEHTPRRYLIRVVSERWPECQSRLDVSSNYLILPDEEYHVTVPSELFDLPVTELGEPWYESLYQDLKYFNHVQTQVFSALYNHDNDVFIAAPPGSGQIVCAELAILRNHRKGPVHVVYIAPVEALAEERYHYWKKRFEGVLGVTVVKLIGEKVTDIKLFTSGDIIISTPNNWNVVSQILMADSHVIDVSLFIVDDLHLLGGRGGHILEVLFLRMATYHYRAEYRIVAFSTSVSNARELVQIMDVYHELPARIFDFPLCARPMPLDIQIQSVDIANFEARMEAMVKTTYYEVSQHAKDSKPAIVFVPTVKHVMQTAMDLRVYSGADSAFLLRPTKQFQHTLIEKISDELLKVHLSEGIAYLYEGLSRKDQDIVIELFESGCIQVCVLSNLMCWGLRMSAQLVIVMGTQFFDGPISAQTDYPVTDILQMTGHAGCPLVDDYGKCVILCHSSCMEYYRKFLYEKFPVESCLQDFLVIQNHLNSEIMYEGVKSRDDALFLLRLTFMYRRHIRNPSFYDLLHLTQLDDRFQYFVDSAQQHLLEHEFIEVDTVDNDHADVSFVPLPLGRIAARFNVDCETVIMFERHLDPETTLKDLLEVVCSASEFNGLPTRYEEEEMLCKLIDQQRFSFGDPENVTYPKTKAYALLQAHFSRHYVDGYLELDQREVVLIAHKLLSAIVYVTATYGWFNLTHLAVKVSQMVTQGMWQDGSLLLQVPHFTEDIAKNWKENAGIETIHDLLGIQNESERAKLLSLSTNQQFDVLKFCKRFPDIKLFFEVLDSDNVHAGDNITIEVTLERDLKGMIKMSNIDIDTVGVRYPKAREISWWLFVIETGTNIMLDLRRVYVTKKGKMNLKFAAPKKAGMKSYTIYVMSDSYLGCDKMHDFTINVL